MKRRNFLRTLGIGALAVPVAIEAVKGIELPEKISPEDEKLLESLHKDAYEQSYYQARQWEESLRTINLIAPVKPSEAGEAIYLYTDKDNARVNSIVYIPAKYFDGENLPQAYLIVGHQKETASLLLDECFQYNCFPLRNNSALTKEIPATQKLIIGANAY